jgi:hypothetical protein
MYLNLVIARIAFGNPGMDTLLAFLGVYANPRILHVLFPFARTKIYSLLVVRVRTNRALSRLFQC